MYVRTIYIYMIQEEDFMRCRDRSQKRYPQQKNKKKILEMRIAASIPSYIRTYVPMHVSINKN